jgi:hypothetical protein
MELGIHLVAASKREDMRECFFVDTTSIVWPSQFLHDSGILFNGMGGWASVNHLHLQGAYLKVGAVTRLLVHKDNYTTLNAGPGGRRGGKWCVPCRASAPHYNL